MKRREREREREGERDNEKRESERVREEREGEEMERRERDKEKRERTERVREREKETKRRTTTKQTCYSLKSSPGIGQGVDSTTEGRVVVAVVVVRVAAAAAAAEEGRVGAAHVQAGMWSKTSCNEDKSTVAASGCSHRQASRPPQAALAPGAAWCISSSWQRAIKTRQSRRFFCRNLWCLSCCTSSFKAKPASR